MICISIAQESRRFALVDMFNARGQCDLVEVRMDRFGKAPEIKELLEQKKMPVIMSCRRQQDGGQWEGTEEERLALLRQCIICKADYVEIELDVADKIRPFPPAKRVISYTNLSGTPDDIASIYQEATRKQPDVIKLVTLARTPEEAWPLVQILAKSSIPTVIVGLGKPGIMLSILGKKVGAPWTYAALERGMETYPGEPTVQDLRSVYHYEAINKSSRFIGVTGFTDREYALVALLNKALESLELPARCLPMGIGNLPLFRKVMDAVKLAGVLVDEEHRGSILEIVAEPEPVVTQTQSADLLVHKNEKWHGYNILCRAAVSALEAAIRTRTPGDKPLTGRMVMIVGSNATARSLAFGVKQRGGVPIIASHHPKAAQEIAKQVDSRFVQFEALYSTNHEVLLVSDDEKDYLRNKPKIEEDSSTIHPGYLKPSMAVMDLTTMPRKSSLIRGAEVRGCAVVQPRDVLIDCVEMQLKMFAGRTVAREFLADALRNLLGDDAETG